MFNYIKGEIVQKTEGLLILESGNVGYELNVSLNTLEVCGQIGDIVKIYTYFSVREDGISLFGFFTIEEKNLFLNLISVSGVGPKLALQILSGAELNKINFAISSGDVVLLSKIKGIGKKTAERIIVELKDKVINVGTLFDYQVVNNIVAENASVAETIEILTSLGVNKTEATRIVKTVYSDGDTTETLVKKSLQGLGR